MSSTNPQHTSATDLLRAYNLRPDKKFGQNFLTDDSILARIVETAQITPQDEVLEVGPGLGNLTAHLARTAKTVTAVELDKRLIPLLEHTLAPDSNVRLVQGDILGFSPQMLALGAGYKIVANIPYYITSALIRHFIESALPPASLTLMVQKEVAQRICAQPGDLSVLALSVQLYGTPKLAFNVPAGAFYPAPEVDSAVLHVDIFQPAALTPQQTNQFFEIVKAGFSQKRKTLRNALSGGLRHTPIEIENWLEATGINPQARAETLSKENWLALCETYREFFRKS
jgi:16S rRNA (adenine1518-N6/adenine1519-N6)-dimethyltransferase